jgi:hypothetical protein
MNILVESLGSVLTFCSLHADYASLGTPKGVPRSQLEALSRKMKCSKPRYVMSKKDGMDHQPTYIHCCF